MWMNFYVYIYYNNYTLNFELEIILYVVVKNTMISEIDAILKDLKLMY